MPETTMPAELAAADGTILVTGGAGFVGSHTVLQLLEHDRHVVVIDNLVNAAQGVKKPACLERIEKLSGRQVPFHAVNLLDEVALNAVFKQYAVSTVIHFAALKAVGESTQRPLDYYKNNVIGTITLLEAMRAHGVRSIIFSSSATVYGCPEPEQLPVTEQTPVGATITNPYGRTKFFVEQILQDFGAVNTDWNIVLLRYFNPVGAHPSGEIGEDPRGIPNNLFPFVSQVAVGRREFLSVYGADFPTRDGTGERDYIHVVDLARGHLAALRHCRRPGVHVYNLGTGTGYTVLEVVDAYRRASGRPVPTQVMQRRRGDVARLFANCEKAARELHWRAELGLDAMCADSWRWQRNNPHGFAPPPPPPPQNGNTQHPH